MVGSVNGMASAKRTQIRQDLLQELYQFHLAEKGRKALIPKLLEDRNPEKYFALEYLAEQRLIRLKAEDEHYLAKITAQGIAALKKNKLSRTLPAIG